MELEWGEGRGKPGVNLPSTDSERLVIEPLSENPNVKELPFQRGRGWKRLNSRGVHAEKFDVRASPQGRCQSIRGSQKHDCFRWEKGGDLTQRLKSKATGEKGNSNPAGYKDRT